jgi:hypothetical protein
MRLSYEISALARKIVHHRRQSAKIVALYKQREADTLKNASPAARASVLAIINEPGALEQLAKEGERKGDGANEAPEGEDASVEASGAEEEHPEPTNPSASTGPIEPEA